MRDEERERRATRAHIIDLLTLLVVGTVGFSLAAIVGLEIARGPDEANESPSTHPDSPVATEPSTDSETTDSEATDMESSASGTDAGAGAAAPVEQCDPRPPEPIRTAGDLTVRNPPDQYTYEYHRRLRSHTKGSLSLGKERTWIGPPVPSFVPIIIGAAELHLLEKDGPRTIAMYRAPYGAGSCELGEPANCDVFVGAWDECGRALWLHRLNDLFGRPDHLEVQDLRAEDGAIYFNEACQSYSKEADGKCSQLVAFDPVSAEVLWRTKPLVSNGEFVIEGDHVIAGYGFTAEPDFLHVIRRHDGEVVHRRKIPRAQEGLRVEEGAVLIVDGLPDGSNRFLLEDWDGANPRLEPAPE